MANRGLTTVQKELADIIKEMKALAKEYVSARKAGNDSKVKKIITSLKSRTSQKKKLDTEIDTFVSNIGKGASVDKIQKMTEVRKLIRQVIIEELTEAPIYGDVADTSDSDGADGADDEIDDAFDELTSDLKTADLAPKTIKEVDVFTIAGIALSIPAIMKYLGMFINLLKRIPGLKRLSGDKLIKKGNDWHHKIVHVMAMALKKMGVKDSAKAEKFADIFFHVIVATLLLMGGISMGSYVAKGKISAATLKGALNAVKTGEIGEFFVASARAIK